MDLVGPLPADTAFLPAKLAGFDTVLAMYHDQGLPVLKYSGFEQAVNLTLGLPYPAWRSTMAPRWTWPAAASPILPACRRQRRCVRSWRGNVH